MSKKPTTPTLQELLKDATIQMLYASKARSPDEMLSRIKCARSFICRAEQAHGYSWETSAKRYELDKAEACYVAWLEYLRTREFLENQVRVGALKKPLS